MFFLKGYTAPAPSMPEKETSRQSMRFSPPPSQAYGESGMTVLEELIDAAFRACDMGHAQGQQRVTGAAALTHSGKMCVGGMIHDVLSLTLLRCHIICRWCGEVQQFQALSGDTTAKVAPRSPQSGRMQNYACSVPAWHNRDVGSTVMRRDMRDCDLECNIHPRCSGSACAGLSCCETMPPTHNANCP